MNLLDRRFLNISLTIASVANEPAANPTNGSQYIVGENPLGDFASASANQIARFNGSAWSFITPKAGELEVLNLDTGEILQFNGTNWVAVASLGGESGTAIQVVDDIVYGYHDADDASLTLSPANLKALRGRPYFKVGEGYVTLCTDNLLEEGNFGHYYAYPEGITALAGFGDGKIYHFTHDTNGYVDDFSSNNLQNGEYIFNKADNSLYFYDAANHKFVKVGGKRAYVVDALVDYVGTSLPASFNSGYASFIKPESSTPRFFYMKQGSTEFNYELNKGFSFANIQSLLTDDAAVYSVVGSDDKGVCVTHDLYDGDSIFNKADGCTYIFKNDGTNKSFVKASDAFIAPVLDIVPAGINLPDYPTATGDKYLQITSYDGYSAVLYTAVSDDDWGEGRTIQDGERYILSTDFKIYTFSVVDDYSFSVLKSDIPVGASFLNKADNCLYVYDGTSFTNVTGIRSIPNPFVAPVLDILNIGSNQPDYPSAAGDKFIFYDPDESQAYGELYNAPSSADWGNGTNISAGQRYASLNEHKIYVFQGDGNEAIISDIPVGATFLNKNDNCLYTFDGSSFVKSASYEPVAPVLAIVPSGSALPANAATGDAFLNTSNAKLYTATAANTWDSGTLTANGSRYASSSDHKIYVSNGTALTATNILNGDLFLNKEENIVYAYDASVPVFVKVGTSSLNITTENHSLTAADVNAKGFSLSFNIAAGQESNTLLFVSGIAQTVGVDFSASGNSISWNNKALDDIALTAGDSFLVQYIRG